ncbi:MAG: coproporphyrinogen III oxidase family protein [Bacteroidales bacterium]|nr:coproporphyrinogen III oxidase family protein [Bacteroidales bacterium]
MIYVHVPFCRSFCTYCGFYSETCSGESGVMEQYADALCREIESRQEEIRNHSVNGRNTIYIGGGTPSVLPLSVLKRIIAALASTISEVPAASRDSGKAVAARGFVSGWPGRAGTGWSAKHGSLTGVTAATQADGHGCFDLEEFTVEVNPDDIVKGGLEYARGLKALGVTRVSMGVQSFDDGVLRWMNRRHGADDAVKAFGILRGAGFDNISIDLIFGFGLLSGAGTWAESVSRAIALAPEHISAYQLSIEPDSALEKMLDDGRFSEADEEMCRGQYDLLCRMLAEAGYVHYEVSNFALPGREARHNSGYWDHSPYVGLGPAAHSFDGRVRSWNAADVGAYIAGVERGSEVLSGEQLEIEDVMLGLRTAAGVPEDRLREISDPSAMERLMRAGALVGDGARIRIPESGFFVSDEIIRELL